VGAQALVVPVPVVQVALVVAELRPVVAEVAPALVAAEPQELLVRAVVVRRHRVV
jgi:hypothetical protein